MAYTQMLVGRILCGKVRDYLSEERMKGRNIQWHESSGWIQRRFTISGSDADVAHIGQTLMAWFKRMETKPFRA
jgi:hypothetical protein